MINRHVVKLFRRGSKQQLFVHINLIGLTISLTAAILIFLFIQDETSYDKFWNDADKIARLETVFTPSGRDPMVNVAAPGPAKEALVRFLIKKSHMRHASTMSKPPLKSGTSIIWNTSVWWIPKFKTYSTSIPRRAMSVLALADADTIVLSEMPGREIFRPTRSNRTNPDPEQQLGHK